MAEVDHAKCGGYFEQGRNHGQAVAWHGSDNLPRLQRDATQQAGYMPVSDIHAGWGGCSMPSLRLEIRGLL
jgi:hypothetical protein